MRRCSPIRRLSSFCYRSGLTEYNVTPEVCLEQQSEVQEFIAGNRAGFSKTIAQRVLQSFSSYSDFDINGMVNIYPLHLFTQEQLKTLMQCVQVDKVNTALDIGSGCGKLTIELNNIVSQKLITTETSPIMCQRLRDKGFQSWCEDVSTTYHQRIAEGHTFDLVSMLNVIDRTP